MEKETNRHRSKLRRAIKRGDADALQNAVFDLPFPPDRACANAVFDLVVETLTTPECLAMDGSHHLLNFFEFEWQRFTAAQRTSVFELLRAYYSRFQDWMSWFVASELLGEYGSNREAFDVVRELRTVDDPAARSFIPHALEHLVRDSGDARMAREAYALLLDLKNDEAEAVRDEAAQALSILEHRGFASLRHPEPPAPGEFAWEYEHEAAERESAREMGMPPSPNTQDLGAVTWTTPCCGWSLRISFLYSAKPFERIDVRWLRCRWRSLDKRTGVQCAVCGSPRKPDWSELERSARRTARRLPR